MARDSHPQNYHKTYQVVAIPSVLFQRMGTFSLRQLLSQRELRQLPFSLRQLWLSTKQIASVTSQKKNPKLINTWNMKNAIEMPSIINKMPSRIKTPSRYVMQRYREIIKISSSWTQLIVSMVFYYYMLKYYLIKSHFHPLLEVPAVGLHVALPLNSAVCLCSEKCKYELCGIAITGKKHTEVVHIQFSGLGKEWQCTYLAKQ